LKGVVFSRSAKPAQQHAMAAQTADLPMRITHTDGCYPLTKFLSVIETKKRMQAVKDANINKLCKNFYHFAGLQNKTNFIFQVVFKSMVWFP
jgi:hypothetical protein